MKRFIGSLLVFLVGLGLLTGTLVVLCGAALMHIDLKHGREGVEGEMRLELGGVPLFWRSLDGLLKAEVYDYSVSGTRSSVTRERQQYHVRRIEFLGATGELGWSERSDITGELDNINRFIRSDGGPYHFEEQPYLGIWDLNGGRVPNLLGAALLSLPTLLFVLGGLSGMLHAITGKTVLPPEKRPSGPKAGRRQQD